LFNGLVRTHVNYYHRLFLARSHGSSYALLHYCWLSDSAPGDALRADVATPAAGLCRTRDLRMGRLGC
jgi:hypothetical protein